MLTAASDMPATSSLSATCPLEAHDLVVRYPGAAAPAVDHVTIALPAGKITALVGPNGSGKSTLLKTLSNHLAPEAGAVMLDGQEMVTMRPRDVARKLSILFQENITPSGLTVEALVYHGRYPHRGLFQSVSTHDHDAVDQAIELAGIDHLRQREVNQLSGGQKQLAWIAMVLAQEPSVLLLDEPTTFLDLRHQLEVMRIVERLRDEQGMTLALVLHDLNQAARHCDRLVAMQSGRIVAAGPPCDVLNAQLLREVFEVDAEILYDHAELPICVPRSITDPTANSTQVPE